MEEMEQSYFLPLAMLQFSTRLPQQHCLSPPCHNLCIFSPFFFPFLLFPSPKGDVRGSLLAHITE